MEINWVGTNRAQIVLRSRPPEVEPTEPPPPPEPVPFPELEFAARMFGSPNAFDFTQYKLRAEPRVINFQPGTYSMGLQLNSDILIDPHQRVLLPGAYEVDETGKITLPDFAISEPQTAESELQIIFTLSDHPSLEGQTLGQSVSILFPGWRGSYRVDGLNTFLANVSGKLSGQMIAVDQSGPTTYSATWNQLGVTGVVLSNGDQGALNIDEETGEVVRVDWGSFFALALPKFFSK